MIFSSDRPKTGVVFETCQGNEEPIIFTGHSRNLWVDFVADHNSSGRGFQISFLTIDGKDNTVLLSNSIQFYFIRIIHLRNQILQIIDLTKMIVSYSRRAGLFS